MVFWKNLKMTYKISFGFFIVLILTTSVGVIGWNGMRNIVNRVENADKANRIIKQILEVRIEEKNYVLRNGYIYIEKVHKLLDDIIILSNDLGNKLLEPEDKIQIESIITAAEVYREAFNKYVEQEQDIKKEHDHSEVDEIMNQAAKNALYVSNETWKDQKVHMEVGMNTAIMMLLLITVVAILLGALMASLITLSIIIPLGKCVEAAKEISKGNYTTNIKIIQKDEIGFLAETFNQMINNLIDARDKLEYRVKERTRELEFEVKEHIRVEKDKIKFFYAIEQSPSIVIIKDIEQHIEYVNPMFTLVSGYSLAEVIGKKTDFLNAGDFPFDQRKEMMMRVFDGQIQRTDFHNKKKNGEEYWVSTSISGIRDNNGILTNILEVQQDITKERALEAQLIQAQKMEAIGTLAGGIAHDFNNILSVVLGYSEYLLSRLDKEDQLYLIMEEIREVSRKGASLTEQLLVFNRKQIVQLRFININDILKGIEKMLSRLMSENVKLHFTMEEDLWDIEADSGQIDQIIMNMAVNASHAMPDGGSLIISTKNILFDKMDKEFNPLSKTGKFISISIKDTGCGMDEKLISQIFDPFFTTKEIGKGTGLGLSVVYLLVEQHKGWINVISEPGWGTEFKIFFPVISERKQSQSEVEIESLNITGNGERVLLIEDNKPLNDFALRVLTENGYIVFSATNGIEAINTFGMELEDFDLIFSDVILPDINGVILIETLLECNSDLKILLTSGYTDDKLNQAQIEEKGYNFLQKPYTMNDLLNKIAVVL